MDVDTVHRAVQGLADMFIEGAKRNLPPAEFQTSLDEMKFSKEQQKLIVQVHTGGKEHIETVMRKMQSMNREM